MVGEDKVSAMEITGLRPLARIMTLIYFSQVLNTKKYFVVTFALFSNGEVGVSSLLLVRSRSR